MWRKYGTLLLLMGFWLPSAHATERVVVLASIEPLAQVLRELFEYHPQIQVNTLLLPNQNPHHVALTPGQAKRVLNSDVVVWLGAEAEPHIAEIIKKHGRFDLSLTTRKDVLLLQEKHEGEHTHGSHLDPHLWLAPHNIVVLVEAIGEHAALFGLNAEAWLEARHAFLQALRRTENTLTAQLAPYQHAGYLSHHDAWGYFATTFSLQRPLVVATNIDGEASSRRVVELRQQMQARNVKCVIAEPEARKGLLQRLCTQGCELYEVDPLGRDMPRAHYTDFLQRLGDQFQACLAGLPQN